MPQPLSSGFFMDYWPYVHEPPVDNAARWSLDCRHSFICRSLPHLGERLPRKRPACTRDGNELTRSGITLSKRCFSVPIRYRVVAYIRVAEICRLNHVMSTKLKLRDQVVMMALALFLPILSAAQDPARSAAFDVASVKLNKSNLRPTRISRSDRGTPTRGTAAAFRQPAFRWPCTSTSPTN
jgi:hypothetical protein